jgi:hypothetical protein
LCGSPWLSKVDLSRGSVLVLGLSSSALLSPFIQCDPFLLFFSIIDPLDELAVMFILRVLLITEVALIASHPDDPDDDEGKRSFIVETNDRCFLVLANSARSTSFRLFSSTLTNSSSHSRTAWSSPPPPPPVAAAPWKLEGGCLG